MPPSANLASENRGTGRSPRDAALQFLYDRIDYERFVSLPYLRELNLERMRELLARLDNPQETLPIVHVAGTKGKGSTSAMIGAVLSAAGYRTGVFTSPHLHRIEERMAVDGRPCPEADFVRLVAQVTPAVEAMDREASASQCGGGPTFFEITTAMALLHFVEQQARAAVLEVGLGGRLDSTNVCVPKVSVITSISFDHLKQLGNTLESIAREKAGIIKPGVPVVSGVNTPGPREVIREVCRREGCRLVELGTDFDFEYHPPKCMESFDSLASVDFQTTDATPPRRSAGLPLSLLGRHQGANAAVALAALAELERQGWEIPETALRRGLGTVRWPARVELVARRPATIIDAAHNRASAQALIETLDESFAVRRRVLVFGSTQEKDVRGMLELLLPRFDQVIFTQYWNNPRAIPAEEVAAVAEQISGRRYPVLPQPADAWAEAQRLAQPEDLLCVTGSFFIAAEIRARICKPVEFNGLAPI